MYSYAFFFLASCTKFKKGTTVLVSFVPNKLNKIALWYFCYAVFVKMLSLQCWQMLLNFLNLVLGHLSSQTVSKIWFESREVNLAQLVDLPFRWRTWHWSLKLSACYMPLWALLCFCPNRPNCEFHTSCLGERSCISKGFVLFDTTWVKAELSIIWTSFIPFTSAVSRQALLASVYSWILANWGFLPLS